MRGLSCFLIATLALPAFAVDTPRIEIDEQSPRYSVNCAPGATDAAQCELDEFTYSGWRTYKIECQQCHGGGGLGTTFAPDLLRRLSLEGVDYGRFLYVMDNGYTGQVGAMPNLKKNPRVQKNKDAIFAYLKARADGALPNGRPQRPAQP